jgi:protocatechuate 3,4-dioxygenase beta subunit
MRRKNFLRGLGLISAASLLPFKDSKAGGLNTATGCVLIPQETEGPYPFDLSSNSAMFRQDITEGNQGTPLNLTLTIVNVNDNCNPIPNVRVDIWHCNKDGYYSEYANQPGYLGTQSHVGETFFRGIQISDSNGQVKFTTIYPGWYTGRVTHIHFNVFLNSVLKATSQAAFPDSLNTTVYNTSLYSTHGQNSTTNSNDNVFSDSANTQYEMLTITENTATGGYDASLIVGIAAPVTGVINLSPETGGQFKLGDNFPNPFNSITTIPLTLTNPAQVVIELYDMQGKKMAEVINKKMNAGNQQVTVNRNVAGLHLSEGNYVYQVTVQNENGVFRQCKVLTVTS